MKKYESPVMEVKAFGQFERVYTLCTRGNNSKCEWVGEGNPSGSGNPPGYSNPKNLNPGVEEDTSLPFQP